MNYRHFLFFAFLCTLIISCKKKEDPAPVEETPVVISTGPISGTVKQYDQFGNLYNSNLSNAKVSIDGTSASVLTDTSSHYKFTDLSAGSYTFTFSKINCSTTKMQLTYKLGDTISYHGEIADKPTFVLNNAYVKDTTWFSGTVPGIYYRAFSVETNTAASTVAIFGKTKNLDISDPNSYVNYATESFISKTDYNRFLSYSFLKDTYKFVKKDTVYVKVYPIATKAAGYVDGKLSRPIYSAYGQAYPTLFKIVMP